MQVGHAQRRRALPSFRRADDGVAAVEFALIAAFFVVPLTIVLCDFSMSLFRKMEVENAARAGAGYAAFCGCFNSANIASAVQNATSSGLTVSATPAPTQACACPDGTLASALGSSATPTSTPSCGGTNCSAHGGGFDSTYVTVNAQATYSPMFPYPALVPAGGFVLTGATTTRIN
jgi:Flp pilus assembly protein TadG